jgi:hypothetical protein
VKIGLNIIRIIESGKVSQVGQVSLLDSASNTRFGSET